VSGHRRVLAIGLVLALIVGVLVYNFYAPHAPAGERAARGGSSSLFVVILAAAVAAQRRRRRRREEEGRNG
jgi:hypothetical protein